MTALVKRCALYTRVSTDQQASGEDNSLVSQQRRLRLALKQRTEASEGKEIWREIECFVEQGSAASTKNRPQYGQLLANVISGKYDVVLVTEISRVSRSSSDFCQFIETLDSSKVRFVSLTQDFDTTKPDGNLVIHILVLLAQFERQMVSQRTKANMHSRASVGLHNGGGRPYGYISNPDRSGHLIIVEKEAKTVKMIYEKYIELGSCRELVNLLRKQGYVRPAFETKKGGHKRKEKPWNLNTITHLLTNRLYIGEREINKNSKEKNDKGENNKYQIVKGVWSPIIDKDLFDRVQHHLKINGRGGYRPKSERDHVYLLAGLLTCAHCQTHLNGSLGKGGRTYYRHPPGRTKEGCPLAKNVPSDKMDDLVMKHFDTLANEPGLLDAIVESAKKMSGDRVPYWKARSKLVRRNSQKYQVRHMRSCVLLGKLMTNRQSILLNLGSKNYRRPSEESKMT